MRVSRGSYLPPDPDIIARLATLETRLAALEDERAILQLIARYGPAVDSLSGAEVRDLWSPGGSYDFGSGALVGSDAVAGLVDMAEHRGFVERGSAHVLSLPVVHLEQDRARAVNYSQVLVAGSDGWRAVRVAANLWTLRRGPDGWRVETRINRLLDGSAEARHLLAEGLDRDWTEGEEAP